MASRRAAARCAPPFIDPPGHGVASGARGGRAICPSCGARRMAETAALLVDEVLPRRPMRQWVLSLPFALRFLLAAPSSKELQAPVERIAERIGRALERKGLLVRDCENSYLSFDSAAGGPLDDLIGHSITYRVAMGPRAGQKVFTLQTVPAS